uniref:Uncharacterized protein n=1 Tax=Siphoviridae sp. ctomJ2 TaxID=2827593 RepID=A0A8S5LJW1_9CAUD|nr:MAG TPA: hypothetical protein [Siphoviridae sp. ctomJ2]
MRTSLKAISTKCRKKRTTPGMLTSEGSLNSIKNATK